MASDPNSYGFYGVGYWGRRVFWGNVPSQHRTLDTNGYLEALLKTWGDESESFLQQIHELPYQREPYLVRGREGEGEWFYFTEALVYEDPYWGEVVRLIGESVYADMPETDEDSPPSSDQDVLDEWYPWFPYAPISQIARWWECKWPFWEPDGTIGGDVEYEVVRVRTRSFDWPDTPYNAVTSQGNEVWLSGGDLRIFFDYLSDTGAGSQNGWSVIGEGDGTAIPTTELPFKPIRLKYNDTAGAPPWLTANAQVRVRLDLLIGGVDFDLWDVPDGPGETGNLYPESGVPGQIDTTTSFGTVNYLTGQIDIDLSAAGDSSVAGTDILGRWYVRGYFIPIYPPRMINHLAKDFGFDNDLNDPEDVQRSTIANLTKYFGLKSSQDSYRIRGEISLFDVYMRALWVVCDETMWAALDESHKFHYYGLNYTDIDPRYLRFDDIAGDVSFYDPDTSTWETLLDNALMYEDTSADGYSIGLAFSLDVAQGYYAPVAPPPFPLPAAQRNPAVVLSSTLLSAGVAASLGLQAGYAVEVSMMRVQWDAFNFSKGRFGLTEYDKSAAIPPALGDPVFWIDDERLPWTLTAPGANPEQDVGTWTIVVGVGVDSSGVAYPGPTVGSDVAIKYWPEVDKANCCYCRSNKMRAEIEPIEEAYEFYGNTTNLDAAIERLKNKIEGPLTPIHTRIVDWAVTKSWILEDVASGNTIDEELLEEFTTDAFGLINAVDVGNKIFTVSGDHRGETGYEDKICVRDSTGNDGIYTVASVTLNTNGIDTDIEVTGAIPSAVADGSAYPLPMRIWMKVEQRGEMGSGQTQTMTVYDENGVPVWTQTRSTGVDDATTWDTVVEAVDMTVLLGCQGYVLPVTLEASGLPAMTYGDVRFTFTVSR